MTSKMILCLDYTSPGDLKCDNFAWRLQGLHRAATSALKGLRRARQQPLSGRESVERDDELTMMEAMANPKKTAAVYFAMAEAKSAGDGRALSGRDLAEAEAAIPRPIMWINFIH
jgi:hypothetical protein